MSRDMCKHAYDLREGCPICQPKQIGSVTYEREFEYEERTDVANADRARLRGVLEQVRTAMEASDQGPDGDNDPRRPLASAVWAALASTDASQWLAERERRAGSAVLVGCIASLQHMSCVCSQKLESLSLDALLKEET